MRLASLTVLFPLAWLAIAQPPAGYDDKPKIPAPQET
jgi:hypothetical protein